jgi:hypothetical protein
MAQDLVQIPVPEKQTNRKKPLRIISFLFPEIVLFSSFSSLKKSKWYKNSPKLVLSLGKWMGSKIKENGDQKGKWSKWSATIGWEAVVENIKRDS